MLSGTSAHPEQSPLPARTGFEFIVEDIVTHDQLDTNARFADRSAPIVLVGADGGSETPTLTTVTIYATVRLQSAPGNSQSASGRNNMKIFVTAVWLGIAGMMGIESACALSTTTTTTAKPKPAPAPMIGGGVPAVLLIGGVLLGTKLLKRQRLL